MELAEDTVDDRVVLLSPPKREDEKPNWKDTQWIEWPALQIVPVAPQPTKETFIPVRPEDFDPPKEIQRPN